MGILMKTDRKTERVVLASGSPRRRELLGLLFDRFDVIVSDCEEVVTGSEPEEVTMELAGQKGEAVAAEGAKTPEGRERVADVVIIGADTVVSIDGEILGKPKDLADAERMLRLLSGRSHRVSTGVVLIRTDENGAPIRRKRFVETTKVYVAELTDEEIAAYLDTEEPYDKAGAYGIQGLFGKHISRIEGDYSNVVGLPVHRLYEEWKEGI